MRRSTGTLDLFAAPEPTQAPKADTRPTVTSWDPPAEKVKVRTELIAEPPGAPEAPAPDSLTGPVQGSEAFRQSQLRESELKMARRIFWRQLQQSDPGLAGSKAHPEAPTDDEIDRCVNWILRGVASTIPQATKESIQKASDDLAAYSWALEVDATDWQPMDWPTDQPFDLLAKRAAAFPHALPQGGARS